MENLELTPAEELKEEREKLEDLKEEVENLSDVAELKQLNLLLRLVEKAEGLIDRLEMAAELLEHRATQATAKAEEVVERAEEVVEVLNPDPQSSEQPESAPIVEAAAEAGILGTKAKGKLSFLI